MTVNILQQMLKEEIERLTQDVQLVDAKGKAAVLKGYLQAIPLIPVFQPVPLEEKAFPEKKTLFPYFIVRVDTVRYQNEQTEGGNQAHVMILFAIYDDDPDLKGYFSLTAVMERVIERFQKDNVLGSFWCSRTMNMVYQEDDTIPKFFGAIEMLWNLPDIGMEEY